MEIQLHQYLHYHYEVQQQFKLKCDSYQYFQPSLLKKNVCIFAGVIQKRSSIQKMVIIDQLFNQAYFKILLSKFQTLIHHQSYTQVMIILKQKKRFQHWIKNTLTCLNIILQQIKEQHPFDCSQNNYLDQIIQFLRIAFIIMVQIIINFIEYLSINFDLLIKSSEKLTDIQVHKITIQKGENTTLLGAIYLEFSIKNIKKSQIQEKEMQESPQNNHRFKLLQFFEIQKYIPFAHFLFLSDNVEMIANQEVTLTCTRIFIQITHKLGLIVNYRRTKQYFAISHNRKVEMLIFMKIYGMRRNNKAMVLAVSLKLPLGNRFQVTLMELSIRIRIQFALTLET
ncbi:unnamed protein product [Paramecium octaurelia]|uniref:Uncharacterized protein n=1 Tax=Paramecium octaurelia TaxID=43137 RepID=A0A8S1YLM0_PAROT|nr:unnamed protein product [Paramecium octaurelia]